MARSSKRWRSISSLDMFTIILGISTIVMLGVETLPQTAIPVSAIKVMDWIMLLGITTEFLWRLLVEGPPILKVKHWFDGRTSVQSIRRKLGVQLTLIDRRSGLHKLLVLFDLVIIPVYLLTILGVSLIDLHELTFVRMVRLLLILRVLDIGPLRDFVATVIHSLRSVAYALAVMFLHFYMYAVSGTFLFRSDLPGDFGDLSLSAVTLMHVNSGEGFSAVLDRLHNQGSALATVGIVYFNSYVFVGVILLVGIVTAMITNDVWDHRNSHKLSTVRQRRTRKDAR